MNIQNMTKQQLTEIIDKNTLAPCQELLDAAYDIRVKHYGKKVFLRGLIEFSNFCKNDCYYCGIRHSNKNVKRYRLTKEEILDCCKTGYDLGFRTFVLQSGDDPYYTDSLIADIIKSVKSEYPECALTLSIGEKSREVYKEFRLLGADRFLLRHETANAKHYSKLHPPSLSLENRKECLYSLKETGFHVGAGFMVGSPFQTTENLAEDLLFLKELQPHMVGIGPFIPHKDTPFANNPHGTVELTLTMIALTRLMLPAALIPSTTALGTIDPLGREKGFMAGANVIMPNLSPISVRKDYELYNGKVYTGDEAGESFFQFKRRVLKTGFILDFSRGDPA